MDHRQHERLDSEQPVTAILLEALRAGTRQLHERLDSRGDSLAITDGSLDAEGYARVIAWQADAHASAETGLEAFDFGAAYKYRSRQPALAAEAVEPGERSSANPPETLSRPASLAAAVGRAYVLEGSSLGGNVILGHLRRNDQLAPFAPFPFYSFQRDHGLPQWRAFTAFAKTHPWTTEEVDIAVSEARRVFRAFGA